MFEVPVTDARLNNKDEVVVLLLDDDQGARHPLAIALEFLKEHRIFHTEHVGRQLVVVTSDEGANRIYDVGDIRFGRRLETDHVRDVTGGVWSVAEDALIATADPNRRLPRMAAQRAFWFGWYAQFPETELIR